MVRRVLAICAIAGCVVAMLSAEPANARTTRVSTYRLLAQLTVHAEHNAGYARSRFKLWTVHNGCTTRQRVLISEAVRKPSVGAGCRLTGGKWISPYDGVTVRDSSKLDIDHLVPLEEAWASGAYRWSTATRTAYANDLGYGADLVAVTAHANRSKGDKEPSQYLPPRKSFDCTYEAWWVAVKWRWHLSVNPTEKRWLTTHLRRCGWPTVPRPSRPAITRTGGTNQGPGGGSCYPLTNGGNCYEPGEYCRDSDHGKHGIAGNGEAIVCEDNNGWRWEPA